jgi:hypothetical protein
MEELARYEAQGMELARKPQDVLAQAKEAATALKGVIASKTKPVIIRGEQYLEFEDWQTVGRFYGVTSKVVSTNLVDIGGVQGFEARAVVIRNSDGMELSAADAMCLNDEENWKSRPLFMLRSMAQTRACAKALRNVLAWVVVLAGYRPTPAEEMQGVEKTPIKEPQKKTNGAPSEANQIITTIEDVHLTTGVFKEGDRKGKTWEMYRLTCGDKVSYTTFSKTIGELASKERGSGLQVKLTWKQGKQGRDIVSLEPAEREPGDV